MATITHGPIVSSSQPVQTQPTAAESITKAPRARDYDKLSVAPFKAFLAAEAVVRLAMDTHGSVPASTFPDDHVLKALSDMLEHANTLNDFRNEEGFVADNFLVFELAFSRVQEVLRTYREKLLKAS